MPFRGYRREWLLPDLLAGVTGCVIMIPSVIAYARLIGLPPQSGLYAAFIPLLVYPWVTRCRLVVVGPDIALCLLMATAIRPMASGNPQTAMTLAAMVAALSGLFLLVGSRVRLEKVADFLSKPVLVGYMTGAALIMAGSQLGPLLGISLRSNEFFPRIVEAAGRARETNLPTLFFGLGLLVLLLVLRGLSRKIPATLIVAVLAVAVSALFHLSRRGIAVIGAVPTGWPHWAVPVVDWREFQALVPAAIGTAFLAYTEGILLARAFAVRNNQEVDANRELTALGIANFCNGFFQGFPVTGSQSRTTINDASGAKTQLANLAQAATLAVFLLVLTPVLSVLPNVALAAILIFGGITLVEFDVMMRIYRYYPGSAAVAALTTVGVLAVGVVEGILIGVVLSLLGLIKRISHPPDAVLHEVPGHGFHDVPGPGQTEPGLIVYRFYAPLLFSNCGYFAERVHALIGAAVSPVRWFLIDAQAITDIDVTAVEMLHGLRAQLRERGVKMKFAHANPPLRRLLSRTGLEGEIGAESFFSSVHECIKAFEADPG